MTPRQRLQSRQAETRDRLGEITVLEGDDYSPEIQDEEKGLIAEMRSLDQRLLAADLASDGTEPEVVATSSSDEDPARLGAPVAMHRHQFRGVSHQGESSGRRRGRTRRRIEPRRRAGPPRTVGIRT